MNENIPLDFYQHDQGIQTSMINGFAYLFQSHIVCPLFYFFPDSITKQHPLEWYIISHVWFVS